MIPRIDDADCRDLQIQFFIERFEKSVIQGNIDEFPLSPLRGEVYFRLRIRSQKENCFSIFTMDLCQCVFNKKNESRHHCHVPLKAPLYNLNACIKAKNIESVLWR
jgi:hypothetical protein